jgi:hypothetical protein
MLEYVFATFVWDNATFELRYGGWDSRAHVYFNGLCMGSVKRKETDYLVGCVSIPGDAVSAALTYLAQKVERTYGVRLFVETAG